MQWIEPCASNFPDRNNRFDFIQSSNEPALKFSKENGNLRVSSTRQKIIIGVKREVKKNCFYILKI